MGSLTELQIPEEWTADCRTLLRTLFTSPLLRKTFGQIYDGWEIWETFSESGNITRLMDPATPMEISNDAKEDVIKWVDSQDVDELKLDQLRKSGLETLFSSSDRIGDRMAALTVCLFKPAVRWWLEKYCEHVTEIGKPLPTFGGRRHDLNMVQAIQDWGEERIFGGELRLDGDMVLFALLLSFNQELTC